MKQNTKSHIFIVIASVFFSVLACQSTEDINTNSETAISEEDMVETSVQNFIITDTYTAEIAAETQAAVILLTQDSPVQTEAAPSDTPAPANTSAPDATVPPVTAGFYCVPINTQRDLAQVVQVIDGDTIEVIVNGTTQRVRYIGIDAPEVGAPYYQEATDENRALVGGKTITLVKDISETDQNGLLLRYVFIGDDIFVNYKLVEDGYVQKLIYPPDVACSEFFLEAEMAAKNAVLGLWSLIAPTNTSMPVAQSTATSPPGSGGGNCHPSYPIVCIPPPPPDLDCKDIPYRRFTVVGSDPHDFDRDNNGIGCESD